MFQSIRDWRSTKRWLYNYCQENEDELFIQLPFLKTKRMRGYKFSFMPMRKVFAVHARIIPVVISVKPNQYNCEIQIQAQSDEIRTIRREWIPQVLSLIDEKENNTFTFHHKEIKYQVRVWLLLSILDTFTGVIEIL